MRLVSAGRLGWSTSAVPLEHSSVQPEQTLPFSTPKHTAEGFKSSPNFSIHRELKQLINISKEHQGGCLMGECDPAQEQHCPLPTPGAHSSGDPSCCCKLCSHLFRPCCNQLYAGKLSLQLTEPSACGPHSAGVPSYKPEMLGLTSL